MKKHILFLLLILSNVSALSAMKHNHNDEQGGQKEKGPKRVRTEEQLQAAAGANSLLAQLAAERAARNPERMVQMAREHEEGMRELKEERRRQELALQYPRCIKEIEEQIAAFAHLSIVDSAELFATLIANLNQFFRNYCTHSLKEVIQTFTGLLFSLMEAFYQIEVTDPDQAALLQRLMFTFIEEIVVHLGEDIISSQFGEDEIQPSFQLIQHRVLFNCYILLKSLLISIELRINNLQEILKGLQQIQLPSTEEIERFVIKPEIIEKIRDLIAQIVGAISQRQELVMVEHGLHQQLIDQVKRIAEFFGVPVDLHVDMDTGNDEALASAQAEQERDEQLRYDEEFARNLQEENPAPAPMQAVPVDSDFERAIALSLQDQEGFPEAGLLPADDDLELAEAIRRSLEEQEGHNPEAGPTGDPELAEAIRRSLQDQQAPQAQQGWMQWLRSLWWG